MSAVAHLLTAEELKKASSWKRYLLDSFLAIGGTLLITGIIYFLHLYPGIPNISIIYLLVILSLASTRGSYAAILASVVAFLSFDFFLIPPIFTFVINQPGEWIALFVFLVNALLTSQLAVALRKRAEDASRHEHETRILYDLMRVVSREENEEAQLQIIAQTVVDVFSSWGIRDCTILQPDTTGALRVQACTFQPREQVRLTTDEQAAAAWVMAHGQMMDLYDDLPLLLSKSRYIQRIPLRNARRGDTMNGKERFLPLKMGQQAVGVLRIHMHGDASQAMLVHRLDDEANRPDSQTTFFRTFLDQVSSLLERARLRRDNLRIELLQRTDALRAALLSSVSHDLRTPLTAIKAAASALQQDDVQWDEEARLGFASTIEREADRLNRLVSNLLDMSRIEEGALRPEKDLYSLPALIYEVLDRLKPLLGERVVLTDLPKDLPPVELDYLQIDQVLTNLLENAVRYTPAITPIEIRARLEGSEVLISVADRGPGIEPTDRERIFDKFYRVLDKPHTSVYPTGSGLGLAVCKGLVEAHGGSIWTEPREGGGTIFNVLLPVGATEGLLI